MLKPLQNSSQSQKGTYFTESLPSPICLYQRAKRKLLYSRTEQKETQTKAVVSTKYGSPDILQLKEVEKPAPKDNEVLVKVLVGSLNAADFEYLRGVFFVRPTAMPVCLPGVKG